MTAHLTFTETWTMAFDGDNNGQYNIIREQGLDNVLMSLKSEPLNDDNFCIDDLEEAPLTSVPTSAHNSATDPPRVKRPPGRPRKHPVTPAVGASSKITNVRSKTGCFTCRKRKKKCDEAKPRCMNCKKNALVCEGYPERRIWKGAKERAEEERMKHQNLPPTPLQPILYGLETLEDMIFWKHYNEKLSTVLTVEGELKNAFKDMMVPIATKHQGLMHSILSLASKHIDFDTPYGINILSNNPNTTLGALRNRSIHHQNKAVQEFYTQPSGEEEPIEDNVLISARFGQMLCFFLEAQVEGKSPGYHRWYFLEYRRLIVTSIPNDSAFLSFISEFFEYHMYADELIYSALEPGRQTVSEGTHTHSNIDQPKLLGVTDGMLDYLSQTTAIRNAIRRNMLAYIDPIVDYKSICKVVELMNAINKWVPHWPPGDSRESVGYLYRQMVYIHLLRTVNPPSQIATAIMPSPHAENLSEAVESSLALLKNLRPNDPSQRLLLLPCFIIGTASVAQEHQGAVRIAIKTIKGYTGMRNADTVMGVLEKVWQLMSAGEWLAVWDWPEVAHKMELDFIPA
ncbi:fungal-specific transcription factor domain-containing protein [Lasiosphaeria ovina]|uniref:Fungal-specific transcription factor domain-containing protein n=1 Tax=Lasiosphaeria ovina TaxID=92902 RepID=A0AAE0N583_9PEZI|nr:fungal-specific transcription factor domain-containing protein [Lasiosphaeria ovina]